MVAALVSITLLTYPRFYPLRPACFPRYFLNLCYDWSLCLAPSLPLMVWLRCRFVQAAIALSLTSAVRRSYALAVLVANLFCLVLFFFTLADLDFIASACPHSVRHRSPALHPVFQQLVPTARFIVHPAALVVLQVFTPDGVLRKVRDSNPRAISDSRVSGAVLSTSQPTFLCALRFRRKVNSL